MKEFLKDNWKFLLLVLLGGLIGGYCIGLYSYDSLSEELLKQIQEQNVTKEMIVLSTAIQYGIPFGIVLASIGIVLSKKINLWNDFKLDKKAIITTAIITIISALVLFPGDKIIFGSLNTWVNEQYIVKPTIYKMIGGLLAGGIIEEVMMRLFFMSLVVFIVSNILAALLFAAGHLPSTSAMTALTPVIIFRCFLFNGGLGLTFGYLYRKYNIRYAMIAHGFAHLIADILMLIFI